MQRQRGELVPIADALADLDGLVSASRDDSPQARHSFTVADQVNQLINASEADPDLGFMARTMALCSLPRSNPGNRLQYKRVNGPFTLYMIAGGGNKLPFGNLPRLLMAWLSTEAVRTQSRELVLGRSLSEFMRVTRNQQRQRRRSGEQTRLRNQMNRLFGCTVSLIYEDESGLRGSLRRWQTNTSSGGTSVSPVSGCCGTARSTSVRRSSTKSSTIPYRSTQTPSRRSSVPRWASISTSGWCTAPSRFALRSSSPGVRCTGSSERIRPKPATTIPSKPSGTRFSAS